MYDLTKPLKLPKTIEECPSIFPMLRCFSSNSYSGYEQLHKFLSLNNDIYNF